MKRRLYQANIVWLMLACLASCQLAIVPQQAGNFAENTRTITISDKAWSGSSVNVMANVHQTLFTDNAYQYTAFYDEQARLVLGKRPVGSDQWQLAVSQFSGNAIDAHNHISLVVDGKGYLHLSWDQHNVALKYAVSVAPGSLQLASVNMLGENESAVTYPQFYRLLSGDLLFVYRDGGSGNGNIVLNRFDHQQQRWQRVQNNLLDGEGQRSAYWDMTLDANGVLHLTWLWRETPDVATNHDLHYAQSKDSGSTWQTLEGQPILLPITMQSLAPVWQVNQQHNLMNPPVIAADNHSSPFIASYWSESPEQAPQFSVISYLQGKWRRYQGPPSGEAFTLSGMGTKNPPWSRATLLVSSDAQKSGFHLIYRDNAEQAIMVASVDDVQQPQWNVRRLINWPADGWEPSVDPQQWQQFQQVQMLLQHVEQVDGDDNAQALIAPQALKLLIWAP